MKKLPLILLPFFVVLALSFWFMKSSAQPVNPKDTTPRKFVVVRGWSAAKIANRLEKEGLVKNATVFRLYTQLKGSQKAIIAGEYRIAPSMSLSKVLSTLLSGPVQLWVTYPEGLRREEVAAKTIKILEMGSDDARVFWNDFMKESESVEGFLFPDTYLFPRDVKGGVVVAKLRQTFDQKVTGQISDDVITLASIVEKETKTDDERPIVAGILLKRLKTPGWRLQADATLQYITGKTRCGSMPFPQILDCDWWKPPTIDDKSLKSPYNTYLSDNLPLSPIANPGLSSIKAVISPEDSPYWYYLHDNEAKIHYAKTIEEHTENINKYLR